jgi:hypothetical protein
MYSSILIVGFDPELARVSTQLVSTISILVDPFGFDRGLGVSTLGYGQVSHNTDHLVYFWARVSTHT